MLKEIEEMAEKEAIVQVQNKVEQFLILIFVVPKSTGHRRVINLKEPNFLVEYNNFKLEKLFLLNELLEKNTAYAKKI